MAARAAATEAPARSIVAAAVDRGPITADGHRHRHRQSRSRRCRSAPTSPDRSRALDADFNSPVKQGPAARQDRSRALPAEGAAAEADLANARATLAKARADLELKERNSEAATRAARPGHRRRRATSTRAESEARQAEAQIALAEAAVRIRRGPARGGARQPRLHRIVSPVDGVVVSRNVSSRPDGRRELPDADAVPGRHGPDQDAGERERQRVRHRRRGRRAGRRRSPSTRIRRRRSRAACRRCATRR